MGGVPVGLDYQPVLLWLGDTESDPARRVQLFDDLGCIEAGALQEFADQARRREAARKP